MSDSRIAVSEVTTTAWGFEEDVREYSQTAGVDGIGVWREKLAASEYSPTEARDRLDSAGLAACSLIFAGGFTESFEEQIADAREAIRTADILGAPALLLVAGPRIGISAAEGTQHVTEALQKLAPVARDAGVTLALEPIHPVKIAEYSTVVTLEAAVDIVRDIDGAGIMLDIWNSWWEPDICSTIEDAGAEIAAVQISDHRAEGDPLDRAPPGEGIVPLADICSEIERTGYEDWYEVELFTDSYAPEEYPELLERCVEGTEAALSE